MLTYKIPIDLDQYGKIKGESKSGNVKLGI